jgi:hypothetical protein
MWTLDCSYYDKSFSTLRELIDDVLESGMDPNYEVVRNGRKIGETLADFLEI